jgi:hypothetical protein
MHGQKSINLCDAKQVYQCKNTKIKLYKNNAAIWYNITRKLHTCFQNDDTICSINTIWPPEDEHNAARNM